MQTLIPLTFNYEEKHDNKGKNSKIPIHDKRNACPWRHTMRKQNCTKSSGIWKFEIIESLNKGKTYDLMDTEIILSPHIELTCMFEQEG